MSDQLSLEADIINLDANTVNINANAFNLTLTPVPGDATANSAEDLLFAVASNVGEVQSAYINTVGSQTVLTVEGIAPDIHSTLTYARARIVGKGIRGISAWDPASQTLTIASSFDDTVEEGDLLDVVGAEPNTLRNLLNSIRTMVKESFPYWHREVVLDLNNDVMSDGQSTFTMLELDQETVEYTLPSDCAALSRIGVQQNATIPVKWIPRQSIWRTIGGEGNMRVRFLRSQTGIYAPNLAYPTPSFNPTFLPVLYSGMTLCLWYMAREPSLPSDLTLATCQIPFDVLVELSSDFYRRRYQLGDTFRQALTEQSAAQAWGRLGFVKPALPMGPKWGLVDG